MRFRVLAAPLVAALAYASSAAAVQPRDVTYQQAVTLAGQAYRYGFPLMEFLRVEAAETSVRAPDHAGDAPLNTFANALRFARPQDRTVVAPNVDTLYSLAHLDLGKGPIVLEHPSMGRRYFVFELVDPYTNVIGYVGSRTTGSAAGRFAITWTAHPGKRVRGVRVIRSHYRRVWVIGRTLVNGHPADLRRAQALMRRYALVPLSRLANPPRPRRGKPGKPRNPTEPTGLAFFDALGRALAQNPPPARDRPLLTQLAQVGIGPGLSPSHENLPAAVLQGLRDGFAQASAALPTTAKLDALTWAKANDGWAIAPPQIGEYGTDYDFRAVIAQVGLGANTPPEAVYPTALADSSGALLNGAHSYRITFRRGQTPPNRAFWSLTMYDLNGFLVANPQHRYAVGSTHPPLVKQSDGSIVIVLQHSRPAGNGVNWLPAPSGAFRLSLRVYRPTRAVLDGRWKPPPIERIG